MFSNGHDVITYLASTTPELILLDVMLPGMDGYDVCRAIRLRSEVPIIMITARISEEDRLKGFEIGADDYVCKPFSPREVVARIKSILRRHSEKMSSPIEDKTRKAPRSDLGIVLNENSLSASYMGMPLSVNLILYCPIFVVLNE